MKRFSSILILSFIFTTAFAQTDTLRILAIGNSFSGNALNRNFGEISVADGRYVTITGQMYIGGCSLERHWKNAENDKPDYRYSKRIADGKVTPIKNYTLEKALADEKWDVVTFQQSSGVSGLIESYEPYLGNLVEYVKARTKADVRLMWHQTWAYAEGSGHKAFPNYGRSQKKMYEAILDATKYACDKYGFGIIPAGTAVQNIRASFDRDNCTADSYHLNNLGCYLVALTWYSAITGRSVLNNSYNNPDVAVYRCELAKKCADLAVKSPYKPADMVALGLGSLNHTANYDESKVPSFTLPDPLVMNDGTPVKDKKQWMEKRRGEILAMFENEMYGKMPGRPDDLRFEVLSSDRKVFGGKATRKEVKIIYGRQKNEFFTLLVYTPNKVKKAPIFLGANFQGNYSLTMDEGVTIPKIGDGKNVMIPNLERGTKIGRCPLDEILDAGFGIATFNYNELEPDFDGCSKGLLRQMKGDWGTIASWAWGLCRSLDYLETDPDVNGAKVAVLGHSRLGKAALLAGAEDQRFAMVISNDSGCGGAAISRRTYGETVYTINTHFPHWFVPAFKKYNKNENALPFDQHELLALIAPRPLCVGSAAGDRWADPKGEKMALEEACKVYDLFGPKAAQKTQYHIREGKHDLTSEDWKYYLEAARKYLK